jgi:hypothetical protein
MRVRLLLLHFVLQANGNILEGINENIIRPVQQVEILIKLVTPFSVSKRFTNSFYRIIFSFRIFSVSRHIIFYFLKNLFLMKRFLLFICIRLMAHKNFISWRETIPAYRVIPRIVL